MVRESRSVWRFDWCVTWVWETSRLRRDLREEVEGRRLVCSLSMLNDCAVKGHAPVAHPLSMVSQIKSWYSLTVWCPCDRARCLIGSPQRDHLSDSNKQQLDGHFEVQTSCRTFYCPVFSGSHEVSRLTARHLVDHVLVHFLGLQEVSRPWSLTSTRVLVILRSLKGRTA